MSLRPRAVRPHWHSAEVASGCAIDATLQLWERPQVRACSLGGEITVQHRAGKWTGKPFDAVITAFDLDHLALVERGLFPECEVGDEIAVDAAMGWPMGPVAWDISASKLEMLARAGYKIRL